MTTTHSQAPMRHTSDPFAGSSPTATATNLTTSQHHSHHVHYPLHVYHQSVPPTSSSHLLTVPGSNVHTSPIATSSTHLPFLTKQHSHPLMLPSQSSLDLPSVTAGSHHHSLHRQLSYPTTSSDNQNLMLPLGGISLTGASPTIITTSSAANTSTAHFTEGGESTIKMEEDDQPQPTVRHQQHTPVVAHHQPQIQVTPSIMVVSDRLQVTAEHPMSVSRIALSSSSPKTLSTGDVLLPAIRIKGEELQRSISSPLVGFTEFLLFFMQNKHLMIFVGCSRFVNFQSKVVRSIVPSSELVRLWAAISVGTPSMTMVEFCGAKPSTTAPSARPICASCPASRSTTSAKTTSRATLRPAAAADWAARRRHRCGSTQRADRRCKRIDRPHFLANTLTKHAHTEGRLLWNLFLGTLALRPDKANIFLDNI